LEAARLGSTPMAQQGHGGDRFVRQHPGISRAPTQLEIDGTRIDIVSDTHEATRHDLPTFTDPGQHQA